MQKQRQALCACLLVLAFSDAADGQLALASLDRAAPKFYRHALRDSAWQKYLGWNLYRQAILQVRQESMRKCLPGRFLQISHCGACCYSAQQRTLSSVRYFTPQSCNNVSETKTAVLSV